MANEGGRMLFIREAEIVTIAAPGKSRVHLKITAGNKKKKTKVIKKPDRGVMPGGALTINMNLDFAPQTRILWELYGCRWPVIPRYKVLASVEKTLGELFEGSTSTSADIHLFNGSSEVAVLKISAQLDSPSNIVMAVVPNIEKPSECSKFLDPSTLQTVFDAAKTMIDTLAGVHPAATIAWGFLSIGFEVLKNQRDTKDAIWDLYKDMISVYEEFSKDDILEQRDRLQGIYSSLFKQTIECALFIEGYVKKSGIGRLVTMDISDQAEKFSHAFADLKSQLSMGLIKESVTVTLGVQQLVNDVQERVDLQIMRDRLRDLEPPQELGPKSRCMKGTRVATINKMISWISQCNGEMMWCKGLAGTGKSSLMGTLHDLLTDMGGRSRLAAFIRYDRIEYSNASRLITSIAYALGIFDVRIGMAISKVVEQSRSVVTMADPFARFQLLLRSPLERILDLVDEGPLVVIIDGLDECNASSELLTTLAEGFGPKLPFIRLIVSSRPVHHIATAFEGRDCIYPLHLDTSSKSVNRDIQFYLEREFATICNDVFLEKCKELDVVNELTARASGLFIWAATVAKFVRACPGISRLQALLDTKTPNGATEALTTLYRTALDTLVSEPGANVDIKKYVRSVLGAVLVTQTPPGMTEDVLDKIVLLGKGSPPSRHIVSMLGSVLSPETEDSPIRLIHKSLHDFLKDRSRCGDEWFVDVTLHRRAIAKQCRIALKSFLKTWSPKSDVDIGAVPAYISKYALFGVFWYSAFDKSDLELFTSFFRCYFLPWLDIVVTDSGVLHFEIMDTVCRQRGLTRMPFEVDIRDSDTIHRVLRSSTEFYRHLHHSSKESPLAGKVTLECMKLKMRNGSFKPSGNNLNIEGVIFVDADGQTKYGFKIVNTTLVPLYVSMFIFDVCDLEIRPLYQPGSAEGVHTPLLPRESLTIRYGTKLWDVCSFSIKEGQDVDVGFLKLFFSTEYLDLSAIVQESSFEGYHQSVPSPMNKIPSACHAICVPIVQKWVASASQRPGGRLQWPGPLV
ncbi:uncharacterized protein EV420DRAFT_1769383 [Desarmillaria tabescens]|uniref:Nephrocystin 3-like N-terminal domain-containing protein n=1 Tax=Armillaria tabescens TaxID=1929756 RepID=A0AA39JD11_ARMTA|nr:uncharacterized protein EV420DRAFT_1769383 [Desarmillaria tabescens]KAK0439725.1 hypothetical protein EV420DRAFT_1769383 [Desarmillaria tabescens]